MLLEEFPFEPGFRLTDGDLLNKVAAEPAYSVDNTVTATGTTQATAYNVRATVTVVTAGADNAGIRLPFPKVGRLIFVLNRTGTGKLVYPYDTEVINGAFVADLPFDMGMMLICTSNGSWAASEVSTNSTGDIILEASDADTATGNGHFVDIEGGTGGTTSGDGGPVTIKSGSAVGTPGDAGDVTIQGGTSASGKSGDIVIAAGTGTTPGTVTITPAVTVGIAPQNTLTITPGAAAANNVTLMTSGTGSVQLLPFGAVSPTNVPTDTALRLQNLDTHPTRISIDAFGANAAINYRKANGTSVAPTAIPSNAVIGAINYFGHDGVDFFAQASQNAIADGAWTPSSRPARISWQVTPAGSTTQITEAMILTSSGSLLIGSASNNALTVTPGATSAGPVVVAQSGTGGLTLPPLTALSVSGTSTLVGTVNTTGALNVGTALTVSGASTLVGVVSTTGALNVGTNETVQGALTVFSQVVVGSSPTTNNQLSVVPGAATTNAITFLQSGTGGITLPPLTTLTVSGATTLSGGGTLTGTFAGTPTLSGAVTFSAAGTAVSVTNNVVVGGTLQTGAVVAALPATKTGTSYSAAATDYSLILQPSGTFTLTLPAASPAGRVLNLKLIAAFAVNSASANVVPLVGGSAAAGILAATAGKYATLQSDGTNWQIMAAN